MPVESEKENWNIHDNLTWTDQIQALKNIKSTRLLCLTQSENCSAVSWWEHVTDFD